jgi:NAD(P)-dependent dehydrogenase (short-subunit alcohol dehydrogenase family)
MAALTMSPEELFQYVFRPLTAKYHKTTYPAIDPFRPELSTKGKSAIVTGAGQGGIGASIAESLAKSGISSLALVGRNEAKLLKTKAKISELAPNTKVYIYTADIVDLSAVSSSFDSFVAATGSKIDILVANAGYMPYLETIAASDPEDWWSGFEINIKGNFNLLRSYAAHAAQDGVVVHISSAAMHMVYMPNFSSYRGSKMGATKVFEIFGHEMKELGNGVRVVQVHPGLIRTGMESRFEKAAEGLVFDDGMLSMLARE